MTIEFTLNLDLLKRRRSGRGGDVSATPHSRLARDCERAREMLSKLERIRVRQAESGSIVSDWSPRDIWQRMIDDCCSDPTRHG